MILYEKKHMALQSSEASHFADSRKTSGKAPPLFHRCLLIFRFLILGHVHVLQRVFPANDQAIFTRFAHEKTCGAQS